MKNKIPNPMISVTVNQTEKVKIAQFYNDVITGLKSPEKYLDSKYFYDKKGDEIFQQIMHSCDYYLTRCEMDILVKQSKHIAQTVFGAGEAFDVIELGAGDATKSVHLLNALVDINHEFTYFPIDISTNVIEQLEKKLPQEIPGLHIYGLNGEYNEMLQKAYQLSSRKKLILFMGGNIGNMTPREATLFCRELKKTMGMDDLLMIGFDLKKNPAAILRAYNDVEGHTRAFNINLLKRINRELGANFEIHNFDHYPVYDPGTGACKSYLISNVKQTVHIGEKEVIHFEANEPIYMEISQKYNPEDIRSLAIKSGFEASRFFFDSRKWFTDVIWRLNK